MFSQDYKIRAAALALGQFTSQDLSKWSGVSFETVNSWIRREQSKPGCIIVSVERSKESVGQRAPRERGRPVKIWTLRDGVADQVLFNLRQLFPQIVRDPSRSEDDLGNVFNLASLTRAEKDLQELETLDDDSGGEVAEHLLLSAHSSLRVAWERVAELDASGMTIPTQSINRLVDADLKARCAPDLIVPQNLHTCSLVISGFLERLREKGYSSQLAGRVLWANARNRPGPDPAYVIGASLASVFWSQGGTLARDSRDAFTAACQSLPPNGLIEQLSILLDHSDGQYAPKENLEAILYGITKIPGLASSPIVRTWITGLRQSTNWNYRLAPVVLHILADAGDINLTFLLRNLQPDLTRVVDESHSTQIEQWRLDACGPIIQFARTMLRPASLVKRNPKNAVAYFQSSPQCATP